jgi:hypothetical protein
VQAVTVADVCAWGDGVHSVRAVAVDTGGGEAVSAEAATVRVDCSGPAVTVGPAEERAVLAGEPVEPVVSAQDARVGVDSVEVQVQVGSYGWQPYTAPVLAEAGSAYRFRARATDALGNVSSWSSPSAWLTVVRPQGAPLPAPPGVAPPEKQPPGEAPAVAPAIPAPLPLQPLATPTRSLKILTARRRGRTVQVRGRVAGVKASRVTVRIVLRGRRRAMTRTLRIRRGAFAARLRVPAGTRPTAITATVGRVLRAQRTIPAR